MKTMEEFMDELLDESKIKRGDVISAAVDAAKDIHGKPDMKIINSIVTKAIEKAEDTEDAIQIAINMMRAE